MHHEAEKTARKGSDGEFSRSLQENHSFDGFVDNRPQCKPACIDRIKTLRFDRRERVRERQTDKQTDRQTDRQTDGPVSYTHLTLPTSSYV